MPEWSPEQISGHLLAAWQDGISPETIYQRVYADKRAGELLWKIPDTQSGILQVRRCASNLNPRLNFRDIIMSNNTTLTIGIPTYNGSAHIREALDSVISQITDDLKDRVDILISDNASTDGIDDIIKMYQSS